MSRRKPADPLDDLMSALAAATGRVAGPADRRQYERYLDVFLRWNRTHRMTSLATPAAVVRELFQDALLFLGPLPRGPIRLLDLGAGSGIPGLPIRLAEPRISLTLMDSRRKRISFLRAACRELELPDVAVREGRAEELAGEPELAGAFDAVVARAVGSATRLVPIAMRYLRPGGVLVLSGPPQGGALGEARRPLEAIRVPIPGSARTRLFLLARKQGTVPRGT